MYTLFGFDGSGSAAVEIALGLCKVPWQRVDAASWEPGSALADLEAANPLRQIPTLRLPDGSVLTESAAILVHLGLEFPAARLLPAEAGPRAQAIRGLVYIAANCYSAISVIDFPERWCADADDVTNERIRRGARERLHRHWEIFADQFSGKPILGGSTISGLDILAAVVSKWSGARAHLRSTRPDFHATIERIERHPAVAPVFARHWPE